MNKVLLNTLMSIYLYIVHGYFEVIMFELSQPGDLFR